MIEAHSLRKAYGELVAVDDVSFEIQSGEAFALLGPNGAGKTTTIQMLVGAIVPDAGEVRLEGGADPARPEVRQRLGVAPQDLAIYGELSAEENLAFFGRMYSLSGKRLRERVDWALEFAGLEDRRKSRTATFSGGMKRRLNLACALVHDPEILFCDEPTVGVDPQSRNHIFESIEALKKAGKTLIYTTHYMEEAQRLCDRVAILDHGRVLALDSVSALLKEHGGASRVEIELATLPADLAALPGTLEDRTLTIETDRPLAEIASIGGLGLDIAHLEVERPDLERVFLRLTCRTLRDA